MTLIIGLEDIPNNRAILCCDSGAWRGDQIDILRTPKIWRSNGWIAGLSGGWSQSLRARNVMMPLMQNGNPTREECEEAIVNWSDQLLAIIGTHNENCKQNGLDKPSDHALIVARSRWVWYVSAGCVTNVERGYQAIGCEDYAIGALAALVREPWNQRPFDAMLMAERTMRAVETITTVINRPFRWMDTHGEEGTWE